MLSHLWVDQRKISTSIQAQDWIIPSNGYLMCPDLGGKEDKPEVRAVKVLKFSPKTWVRTWPHVNCLYDPGEVTSTF